MKHSSILLACVLAVIMAPMAHAKDVTLEWSWPTAYCPEPGQTTGDTLDIADIQAAEIYVSETPIPASDQGCGAPADTPPASAIIANVSTPNTNTVIDLPCGPTYFVRMRVQANGVWSNFSGEASRTLDCERPDVPVIIRLT